MSVKFFCLQNSLKYLVLPKLRFKYQSFIYENKIVKPQLITASTEKVSK